MDKVTLITLIVVMVLVVFLATLRIARYIKRLEHKVKELTSYNNSVTIKVAIRNVADSNVGLSISQLSVDRIVKKDYFYTLILFKSYESDDTRELSLSLRYTHNEGWFIYKINYLKGVELNLTGRYSVSKGAFNMGFRVDYFARNEEGWLAKVPLAPYEIAHVAANLLDKGTVD